ncbi:MAG: aminotransferase, partial [Clostridiales bacterium]
RGKPSLQQLDLAVPMLNALDDHNFCDETGMDVRNYGQLAGIPEARRLFAEILDMPFEQVIVGGASSINMLHDAIKRCFLNGAYPGGKAWAKLDTVKFICPVPGYDWHFHICDTFNIEMIPVIMNEDGPDMDAVEKLAASDDAIKGMICVPMYSNPGGNTYSDEVVKRLGAMKTAAPDFRLFWDNAYCMHHLDHNDRDYLYNIYTACKDAGNEDRVLMFTSTSKITMAGSGICCMAGSPKNIAYALSLLQYQLVCFDKVNQLRHVRFLPTKAAVEAHMEKHAAILRPKFTAVLDALDKEIAPYDIAHWHKPKGGYFICFYAPEGCAKKIVAMCKEAGVTLTPAGAPYPHGIDALDSTLRIAPTLPPVEELKQVMVLFCICVKLAAVEKLLA